jgi:hypothetical protein
MKFSGDALGNFPSTLAITHGLSRPCDLICSRPLHEMRGERRGSSGSPVISITTVQRCRSRFAAFHSGPSHCSGLPACTMRTSMPVESAASAATMIASGMPPVSSSTKSMYVAVQARERLPERFRVRRA